MKTKLEIQQQEIILKLKSLSPEKKYCSEIICLEISILKGLCLEHSKPKEKSTQTEQEFNFDEMVMNEMLNTLTKENEELKNQIQLLQLELQNEKDFNSLISPNPPISLLRQTTPVIMDEEKLAEKRKKNAEAAKKSRAKKRAEDALLREKLAVIPNHSVTGEKRPARTYKSAEIITNSDDDDMTELMSFATQDSGLAFKKCLECNTSMTKKCKKCNKLRCKDHNCTRCILIK